MSIEKLPLSDEDNAYVEGLKATRDKAMQAHASVDQAMLPMWVVYGPETTDMAGFHTARLWLSLPEPKPTAIILRAAHLDEIRTVLPPGLSRVPRADKDSPNIIETWM